MNVNARGDEIDTAGNITKSREDVMRQHNELHTMVPTDDAIPEGTGKIVPDDDWQDWEPPVTAAPATQEINSVVDGHGDVHEVAQVTEEKPATVGKQIEAEHVKTESQKETIPSGGLAAAIAAAKKVDPNEGVEPLKSQKEKETPGVRRI